jgi:hypothetical protein
MSLLIAGVASEPDPFIDHANIGYYLLFFYLVIPLVWCAVFFWLPGWIAALWKRNRGQQECAGQDLRP